MVQKYSRQRELLLEELRSRKDHPTADHIYAALRSKLPNISLGTVYRNLSSLTQSGQIVRIEGEGPDRFDSRVQPHYHFTCQKCGCVLDVDIEIDDALDKSAGHALSAHVHGHSVMFFGTCGTCHATDN